MMEKLGRVDCGYAVAFESSGLHGSIALGRGGEVMEARSFSGPRKHAVDLLPTLEALCLDHSVGAAQICRVYVSEGPGSFTGLRIGITMARMIALSTRAALVGVPTLEVIAQNAIDADDPPKRVAVILDAKRNRVYAAVFRRKGRLYVPKSEPAEVDPESFLADQDASCAVLGEGVPFHREIVEASGLTILPDTLYRPRAETVYSLGLARANRNAFVDRRALVPLYIRPPEAQERWEQRQESRKR